MKMNSVRLRSLRTIAVMALGMAVSIPDITHAADLSKGADNFYQERQGHRAEGVV